ncbi:MAG: hypothetical protein H6741_18065 [Alphaproteobacteria bacterium]|nr:hypothetical protein [Alphaproteobacteria bacterium]
MSTQQAAPEAPKSPESIILDLGRQSAKKVKKLRRGEGGLYDDVQEAVQELKSAGTIAADAQTVIVVVERKLSTSSFPFPVPVFDDDDD